MEEKNGVNLKEALGHTFESTPFSFTEKDVILYALGIGAGEDPTDDEQLKYIYEGHPDFQAFPTLAVCFPLSVFANLSSTPGLKFNPMLLLHGEHYLEIKGGSTLPTSGTLTTQAKISNIYDKGKGALLIVDCETKDSQNNAVCTNQLSLFIRGIGGFGGERGPSDSTQLPNRKPDAVDSLKTRENSAAIYRLSGDRNPLHIDKGMAEIGGFDRPILHGLCSLGYAARSILKKFGGNDPKNFKSIRVRFSSHVFPGETIQTEMWKSDRNPLEILFQCRVVERDVIVLSNCSLVLNSMPVQSKL